MVQPRHNSIHKYLEKPIAELPGCTVYSIRKRQRNLPKDDKNYKDWNPVCWNIEKKSNRLCLTAYGDTKEEAVAAMREMLTKANACKIDTYNGIPGSGLGQRPLTPDQIITEYTISPESFYNICIEYGRWKNKSKGRKNNNCGRNQTHQKMRTVRFSVEYEIVERVKEKQM